MITNKKQQIHKENMYDIYKDMLNTHIKKREPKNIDEILTKLGVKKQDQKKKIENISTNHDILYFQ